MLASTVQAFERDEELSMMQAAGIYIYRYI